MDQTKEFKCNRCGCCCKNLSYLEEARFLDSGNGVCKYYDEVNRKCMIYDFRPDICRVDKMYKRYKDKMTWDEYIDANYEACGMLRKLERDKNNEVVEENKNVKVENDWYNNKVVIEKNVKEEYLFDDDEDFFG